MLKFLVASSVLLAIAFGQEQPSSTGESTDGGGEVTVSTTKGATTTKTATTTKATRSNYYRVALGSLYFPLAVDQCSAASIGASLYYKPHCLNSTHIEVPLYSSATCTDDSLLSRTVTNNGTIFRCDGVNTYSELYFGVTDGGCSSKFYGALDACIQYSSTVSTQYTSISCTTNNAASLKVYTTSTCTGPSASTVAFNNTCKYAFPVSSISVYGQASTCSAAASVSTTGSSSMTTSSGGVATTSGSGMATTSGSGMATTGSSVATTGVSSNANTVAFKNIVAIFMMIVCIMISQL